MSPARANPIAAAVAERKVVIVVGAGGVGKTTLSAALALRAALDGRSALVCTIDPAKRLANALGLQELGNAEARIDESQLASAGLRARAPLHAMMLDMKRSWDELIERYAPPDRRERILQSQFYKALSTRLAGSQEYIALEKLWQLRTERDYALIVLDTPPTAHALDFLEAPTRVLDFLDNEAARFVLGPALAAGKVGLKLFNLGGSYVVKTLGKFTGVETLQELARFMMALSAMSEGFRERTGQVRDLMSDRQTAFVLVTGPNVERLDEVAHFYRLLRQNEMEVAAIVVNKVHPPPGEATWAEAATLAEPLRGKVEATLREASALAAQDLNGVSEIRKLCPGAALVEVPRFDADVHDLSMLWRTAQYALGDEVLARAQ